MGKGLHLENFPHVSLCGFKDKGPLAGGTCQFIRPEIEWVKVSTKRTSLMYPHHMD